jgi:hypothetical protein
MKRLPATVAASASTAIATIPATTSAAATSAAASATAAASTVTATTSAASTWTATTSAAAGAATPATSAFTRGARFVHHNIAAHEILAVQALNGSVSFFVVVDLDEAEAAGLPRKSVAHQGDVRRCDSRLSK